MHRLFIALPLPEELIVPCLEAMDEAVRGVRWVAEENLHCTLRFIGEVDRHQANDIAEMLGNFTAPRPSVTLDGVGIFDHGRHGALWARLSPKMELVRLHDKLDRMLQSVGLPADRRAYLPHITLGRWSDGTINATDWAARWAGLASPLVPLDRFCLFESRLGRHGPTYQEMLAIPLGD